MKKSPLDLRPTQFVLGMKEVESKIKKIKELKNAKLAQYIQEHVVPCVVGPGDQFYMIDHHHYVSAVWQCSLPEVKISMIEDHRTVSQERFWQIMRDKDWLYLYDQFGNGPHDPSHLPYDIRGLSDDVYRSLAWELRNAGVIAKVQQPYCEFRWAQYLRKNLKVDLHAESYAHAVERAIALVSDKIARHKIVDSGDGSLASKE